jgi:hypothetical protein
MPFHFVEPFSRSFHISGFGVVTSRLCFQVLDGSLIADLVRDLQAKFRLRAKILRVSHALTPSFLLLLLPG